MTCSYQDSQALAALDEDEAASSACLGRGGSARVFAVENDQHVKYAMKVVIRDQPLTVDAEFDAMKEAAALEECREYVIPPMDGSFFGFQFEGTYETDLDVSETVPLHGWAYLMSEIGTSFPDEISGMSKSDLRGIITALMSLHRAGKCHGDARVQNFVHSGDRWKIVDLRDFSTASPQRKIDDFCSFYKSLFLGLSPKAAHATAIEGFVQSAAEPDAVVETFWNWWRNTQVTIVVEQP
jgi:hypothetical protein